MITSTQLTDIELFAFIVAPVFELVSRKYLFINIKDEGNC